MSLIHKTNSVLNLLKPVDLMELSDRYKNIKTYEYQNINYTSRKETSNINNNFNTNNEISKSDIYNRYKSELSEKANKKINQLENNNSPDLSFKKKLIKNISCCSNIQNKNQIFKTKEKKLGYMNEKYIKMMEENKQLKDKLSSKELENKTELEKELFQIKEDNSKLQTEIIKLKKINDEYIIELRVKNELINKLNNDINNMNIKITELNKENIKTINNLKIIIQKLSKDKNILIDEISDLNRNLTNKIKPKLMKNENYLLSLEQQFNLLKKENDSLIENDIKQKILINNYKNKNKTSRHNTRRQNNINSNNIVNISKTKSNDDLKMKNNDSINHTTKKSKIIKKKSHSTKTTISKEKGSQKIKRIKHLFKTNNNLKRKRKLKKSQSQKKIKIENILKNKNDISSMNNTLHNNKEIMNREETNRNNNISDLLYKKSIKKKFYNTTVIKKNNNDVIQSKGFLYKPKIKINNNRIINEENKENQLMSFNIKKETTCSLLSSYNEDLKF